MELELWIAVAVGVITLVVLLFLLTRSKARRPNLIITGICDSGKTLMFTQLVNGVLKHTQTSMKENAGTLTSSDKKVNVVDIPGHERLRLGMLEKYISTARAVIFVIDSSTIQKDIKDAAEYLYLILTSPEIHSWRVPILVACNKQDLPLTKSSNVIKALLEKELATLKKTKSAALEGTDGSSASRCHLGKSGDSTFEFSQLHPQRIDFVECSAKGSSSDNSSPDLDKLRQWVSTV